MGREKESPRFALSDRLELYSAPRSEADRVRQKTIQCKIIMRTTLLMPLLTPCWYLLARIRSLRSVEVWELAADSVSQTIQLP